MIYIKRMSFRGIPILLLLKYRVFAKFRTINNNNIRIPQNIEISIITKSRSGCKRVKDQVVREGKIRLEERERPGWKRGIYQVGREGKIRLEQREISGW